MSRTHRLGPLSFSIEGDTPVAALVRESFAHLPNGGGAVDLLFRFVPTGRLAAPADALKAGRTFWTTDELQCQIWNYRVRIRRDGRATIVEVENRLRKAWRLAAASRRLPPLLQRFGHPLYRTYDELLAHGFVFSVFNSLLEVELLRRNATLLHASAIADRHGAGHLFSGWGGSGKTSLSSSLIMGAEGHWRFIADDLVILDKHGTLYPTCLFMHIYPYNLENSQRLQEALKSNLTRASAFHWGAWKFLKGASGVARRLKPHEVYGEIPNTTARLARATLLRRTVASTPDVRPSSPKRFAFNAVHTLMHELRYLLPPVVAGGGETGMLPGLDEFFRSASDIIESAVGSAACVEMRLPESWPPPRIATYFAGLQFPDPMSEGGGS